MPDMKKQSNASQTLNVALLLKTWQMFFAVTVFALGTLLHSGEFFYPQLFELSFYGTGVFDI